MPRAFDITAVTDSIRLDASGRGEMAFTVSNALRAAVRARVSVVPGPGAKAEWFTLQGGEERDFAPDGTQQLTVQVRTPPGTPPGRLSFHLLVVDVTDPDERYAEGPSTGFEVVATPPPKKAIPWLWLALAAGIVLILGTVIGIVASRGEERPALNEPCPEGTCDKGLACTAADGGVCLVAEGQPCDGGAVCLTGFCGQKGQCELALGQNCTSDASCPGPLKCAAVPGSQLCLLRPKEACGSDRDCASFFCRPDGRCNRDDGRCDSDEECRAPSRCGPTRLCQLPDKEPCTTNEVCLSGFCDERCKPAPVPARCPAPCPAFSTCISGRCVIVRDHRINQDVLMGSPQRLESVKELQLEQNLEFQRRIP
ncbi:COG1470 family protein [Pyxidicoccus xibeiensis]|uniref:COG1470 family protein n=1 Tax=Pyxidicoccus xibeiensis TaxID=2906759 RepID=UPI0020A74121|nr:hypothetical protein [Pyxidicoccus xibeiensis]MCP3141703.1 hypothetical protein [Pyxidicoccus xibeiensis]